MNQEQNNFNTQVNNEMINNGFNQPQNITYQQQPNKPKTNKLIKILAIIGGIVVVIMVLTIIIIAVTSSKSEKLICEAPEGKITIMYNDKTITGYLAKGIKYDFDGQKEYAEQIGVDSYIEEFSDWFKNNTSGACIMKGKEIKTTEVSVDWDNLKINIDGIDYSYPFNITQFIENGWQVNLESQDIINQTVTKASEYTLTEEEKQWYIENGFEVPSDTITTDISVYMHKNNSELSFVIAKDRGDIIVKNATIRYLQTKNVKFNLYGIKTGSTIKQIQEKFGTKNYELIEKEHNTEDYISYYNSNKAVEFILDKETNRVEELMLTLE